MPTGCGWRQLRPLLAGTVQELCATRSYLTMQGQGARLSAPEDDFAPHHQHSDNTANGVSGIPKASRRFQSKRKRNEVMHAI
ncbi:hypothetical protein H920_14796 [Fukomys damarensis]|uniref:Uncharacterized protein n=1 Tax=Fukomys damarensis TaxID=885580 RepID=A0A091CXX5_FUKDA|nr:hypothetical protein H920_14796 [Fukomys damarensis]